MKTALEAAATVALIFAAGCAGGPSEPAVRELETPAPPGSRFPSLAVHEGRLHLSWIEGREPDAAVRFAVLDRGTWSEPETIAAGPDLFVNWADFPTLAVGPDGAVVAQWLVRAGGTSWAYGIRFAARSADGSWSSPQIPHGEDHAGEHGFVSMVPRGSGAFDIVWLDGRAMEHQGPMELRAARWEGSAFGPQQVLDGDVCSCCQTDMIALGDDRLVVYRDHAPGEIRDISVVRRGGDGWTAPSSLHRDGWQIAACPVNGPAAATFENSAAVAWFTQARDEPRVWAKLSDDFGRTFGEPLRLDGNDPIGRIDAATLADGSHLVSWLERSGDGAAVTVRRIRGGEAGPAWPVGTTSASRDSGFPRLAAEGRTSWVTWTDTTRPSRVRLREIRW